MATTHTVTAVNEHTVATTLENFSGTNIGSITSKITKDITSGDTGGGVTVTTDFYVRSLTDDADCADLIALQTAIAAHFTGASNSVKAVLDTIKES